MAGEPIDARELAAIAARLRAAPDHRMDAIRRVTAAAHRWSEASAEALLGRARQALAHGAPPSLRQVIGLGRQERPMNQALGWLLDPGADHGAGGALLARVADALGADALAADARAAPGAVILSVESSPPDWPGGKMPDLLLRGPTGALLIENKIDAAESGEQYAPYARSFAAWAPGRQRRLWLLAAAERPAPPGYRFATHRQLARWLRAIAEDAALPPWTRVILTLVAEDLSPRRPALGELRRLVARCEASPDPRALLRVAELLDGWQPSHPWSPR